MPSDAPEPRPEPRAPCQIAEATSRRYKHAGRTVVVWPWLMVGGGIGARLVNGVLYTDRMRPEVEPIPVAEYRHIGQPWRYDAGAPDG